MGHCNLKGEKTVAVEPPVGSFFRFWGGYGMVLPRGKAIILVRGTKDDYAVAVLAIPTDAETVSPEELPYEPKLVFTGINKTVAEMFGLIGGVADPFEMH